MDLRRRVVAAYRNQEGGSAVLPVRFSVSRAVVGKLVHQHRDQGTLEPQVHVRGRKPAISGEKEDELRRHLRDHRDATLRRAELRLTGRTHHIRFMKSRRAIVDTFRGNYATLEWHGC